MTRHMTAMLDRWLPPSSAPVVIARGHIRDYDELARFHYRAGRPATHVAVWTARAGGGGKGGGGVVVGVVVVSMPTLNGSWREVGLAGVIPPLTDKRARAAWMNAHLRTISRVVVDPRVRGTGLATRLVRVALRGRRDRASLARWRYTEAIAAMGAYCPFFESAGMTPVPRAGMPMAYVHDRGG